MSVVIKNVSGQTKVYAGITIPNGGSYTVQEIERPLFANDELLNIDISNSNAIVNDGVSDLGVVDGLNFLKGFFPNPINVKSGSLDFPSGFKVINDFTSQSLSDVTPTTIYSRSGSGKVVAFTIRTDSTQVKVKMTIDGVILFDILLDDFKKFKLTDENLFLFRSIEDWKGLVFQPTLPLAFDSSCSIEVLSNSGTKNLKGYIVTVLET